MSRVPPYATRPREPVLIAIGGLPATGKTTIARALATALPAAYVRIDTIETAIARSEGDHEPTNAWNLPPGYQVGYAVAADQLRTGLDVVAESVNPVEASRASWRATARETGARILEVELTCSDPEEHRHRAEHRHVDIPTLTKPTWHQIQTRTYEPWTRPHLQIDTATHTADESLTRILAALGA